jgi:TDG/mug DNA glycosylase family protein
MITDLTAASARQLNHEMSQARKLQTSRGFPPVIGVDPRVLVLGSLPGQASLAAQQYYAQPQNAFWMIMGELCGARPELGYADRLEKLQRAGIAVWDVLYEAARPGSLDSSIVAGSQTVNDIAALVSRHATIRLIAFNGQKAAEVFRRRVTPTLTRVDLETVTLPSTSPAYASMRRTEKLVRWRQALKPHLPEARA